MKIRELDHQSTRDFVASQADKLIGSVLDYGCGKQPYRDIVESIKPFGGPVYQPFDQADFPANVSGENVGEGDPLHMRGWGTILCTQVVQYLPNPAETLGRMFIALRPGGWLVMTGPTNWPVIEKDDLQRFTPAGIGALLHSAGFQDIEVVERGSVSCERERWILGWGAVART